MAKCAESGYVAWRMWEWAVEAERVRLDLRRRRTGRELGRWEVRRARRVGEGKGVSSRWILDIVDVVIFGV